METKFAQDDDMETVWRWHALIWRLRCARKISEDDFASQMTQWRIVYQAVRCASRDDDPIWQAK